MKCPVCDTENAPGLTVCDMCGSELPETKKCKACGAEIPKKAAYCPECKNLADVKPASDYAEPASGMPMYCVGLDYVGDDRQEVIKVVQALRNCSFDEARDVIDGDGIVLSEVPKLEAEIAVSKLRGAGAKAEMAEVGGWESNGHSSNNRRSSGSSYNHSSSAPKSSKSKLVAGLLALFVGGIGVHNFYLGYMGRGIAQLLLSWTGITSIWALVEAIMIFTGSIPDANGNPLGN